MSSSIRSGLHFSVADTIIKEIQYQRSNYYFFLGKIEPWGEIDTYVDENLADSDEQNSEIRSGIIYINKITPTDISLVTRRNLWEPDMIWSQYDHTKDMSELKYYVVTPEYNVYKCLSNDSDSISTVKPVGKSTSPFRLGDGYIWKYMYNIPIFKRNRFMSYYYIPVQTALSDSFYNNGSVSNVIVEDGGAGYVGAPAVTITTSAIPHGSGAAGYINVNSAGQITSVRITNVGTDYIGGVKLTIDSKTGVDGELTATIVGGQISSIQIKTSGESYTQGDKINFLVGGLLLIPSISKNYTDSEGIARGGSFVNVTIMDPGIGYVGSVPLIINAAQGTGVYGNATALLSAVVYQGSVVQVNILDKGTGYDPGSSVLISVFGDGTNASLTPVIYNGSIIDVVINDPGKNYTSVIIDISSTLELIRPAKITPVLASSDFNSDQYIVEQASVPGAIYAVVVTEPGTNYTSTTQLTIEGDGTGATATFDIVDGGIGKITMLKFGSDYTYANIVITDPQRAAIGTPVDCVAYAILPPKYGHGRDAVKELGSRTVAFSNAIKEDPTIIGINQEFRYFGLLKNPTNLLTGEFIRVQNNLIAHRLVFSSVVDLVKDEVLVKESKRYRVVSIEFLDGLNIVTLQQIGYGYSQGVGTYSAELSVLRTYTATESLYTPIVDKYSGDLLFASAENQFSFTADQTFIIKTFITV
jgi:hypothetical protein